MKLRPLHDRVIVKRLENETKTASGIVIPDNAAEKPDQGEVTAVGPGKRNDKGDFIAGRRRRVARDARRRPLRRDREEVIHLHSENQTWQQKTSSSAQTLGIAWSRA
jgi:hypothetical protein